MNKQVYTDIKSKIETELSGTINHVELFNSQFDNEKQERPFKYPALFIEFSGMEFKSESFGVQKCDAELTFHIGFHSLAPTTEIFDIVQSVFEKFNGFSTSDIASFERIREVQDVNHDGVVVWQQIYSATITDDTANKTKGKTETQLTQIQIVGTLDIDNDVIRTGDGK